MRQLIWLRSDLRVHDNTRAERRHGRRADPCRLPAHPRTVAGPRRRAVQGGFLAAQPRRAAGRTAAPECAAADPPRRALERRARGAGRAVPRPCRSTACRSTRNTVSTKPAATSTLRRGSPQRAWAFAAISIRCCSSPAACRPAAAITSRCSARSASAATSACTSSCPRFSPCPGRRHRWASPDDALPSQVPGFATPDAALRALWPAGESAALQRLTRFAEERIAAYPQQRDLPALPGTSQLSPYLAAGVLSPRQCLHAALRGQSRRVRQRPCPAPSPGSTSCCGASSTSTCWSAFPRVSPAPRLPPGNRGAALARRPGRTGRLAAGTHRLPAGRCGDAPARSPPAGCTTACACWSPCSSARTC